MATKYNGKMEFLAIYLFFQNYTYISYVTIPTALLWSDRLDTRIKE